MPCSTVRFRPRPFVAVSLAWLAIATSGCPTTSDPVPPESDRDVVAIGTDAPEQRIAELDAVLEREFRERRLSIPPHGAWQVLHGVLAYGTDFRIIVDGKPVAAVDHLLLGGRLQGFDPGLGDPLGDPPRNGLRMRLEPTSKIGQGHRDQWLAILAQAGLPFEQELIADSRVYRISDWVRQVEYDIPLNFETEFSWTLIALTAYRDTEHSWIARDGNRYSIESLLRSELGESIEDSVCGGTHRLIGIAMALDKRRGEGKPIEGVWAEADALLAAAIELAAETQNGDGSYSASYLHRTGKTFDVAEGLGTTGHVLEFLAIAAPDEVLRRPWVTRCADHLIETLTLCRDIDLECGVLYHALHGLQELRRRLRGT